MVLVSSKKITMYKDQGRYRNQPGRKEYIIKKVSEHRLRNKKRLVKLKGGKCIVCGYNKCLAALEFHHRDPSKKRFCVTMTNMTKAWSKVLKEAEKCDLLCANCHREKQYGRLTER